MAKVDLEELKAAYQVIANEPVMFCKECGETDPEGGFYPLWASASFEVLGGWTCNPCEKKIRERLGIK